MPKIIPKCYKPYRPPIKIEPELERMVFKILDDHKITISALAEILEGHMFAVKDFVIDLAPNTRRFEVLKEIRPIFLKRAVVEYYKDAVANETMKQMINN